VARPFREHADAVILDRAAALFARQGFAKTSVQDIAAAVGLSKTGLLHHYRSKDGLRSAVMEQAELVSRRVLQRVGDRPPGAGRDRHALEVLVDEALAHPGLVRLLLAPLLEGAQDPAGSEAQALGDAAWRVFDLVPYPPASERSIRVAGAISALAVLTLTAVNRDEATTWRPHIVATCFDALGHGRPRTDTSALDQVEA
jgi:AcrR family transcriptional regulator